MTRMRWDGIHKMEKGIASVYDELPRVGSVADQKRFFRESNKDSCGPLVTKLTMQRIKGLMMFVTYIESPQFARRDDREKRGVISALRMATEEVLAGADLEYVLADIWVQKAKAVCKREVESRKRRVIKVQERNH